jgi:hypothetical protein
VALGFSRELVQRLLARSQQVDYPQLNGDINGLRDAVAADEAHEFAQIFWRRRIIRILHVDLLRTLPPGLHRAASLLNREFVLLSSS